MTNQKFTYFVIYGTMRCGSNLFQRSLNQLENVACYGELFNPGFIDTPYTDEFMGLTTAMREKNPLELLSKLAEHHTTEIPGFRLFADHDQRMIDATLQDPNCAKIILYRNSMDCFVSLKIAQQTDQWLLGSDKDRKVSKMVFDAAEYENYRLEHDAFYSDIQQRLQKNGETAFQVTYPDQKDPDILAGLARYLGYPQKVEKLKEEIKKQNPAELSDKIENYPDYVAYLSGEQNRPASTAVYKKRMRPNIPKMVTCLSAPILFAPIPSGPNIEMLKWMAALDDTSAANGDFIGAVSEGQILHTGHSQRTLYEWTQSHAELVAVTAVRHPVRRIYDTYMTKIFPAGPGTYDVIRKQLIDTYDLDLPLAEHAEPENIHNLINEGWDKRLHRNAFHQFLKFVKKNLAGQTGIRQDGFWTPQTEFINAFHEAIPISLIIREGQMDPAFRFIENKLDLDMPTLSAPAEDTYLFPLEEIYTQQTENLVRKAFDIDYKRLVFSDCYAA